MDSKSTIGRVSGYKIPTNILESLNLDYLCITGGIGINNVESLKKHLSKNTRY